MNTKAMTPVSQQLCAMHRYVELNLAQCCIEIITWHRTAILSDGHVRIAARLLTDSVFSSNQLVQVENYVKHCAMERVIANSK